MFKHSRIKLVLGILPVAIAILLGLLIVKHQFWQTPRLIMCDVGQGDAFLLTQGSRQILIDGGPDDTVLDCLHYYMPWFDHQLELVIATHFDSDHIGGLISVLPEYSVKTILMPWQQKESDQAKNFSDLIAKEIEGGAVLMIAQASQHIKIDKIGGGTILWPPPTTEHALPAIFRSTEAYLSALKSSNKSVDDDTNAGSVVLLLDILNTKILLTGDADESTELALRDRGVLEPINVIKVGHHGSKSSSSAVFLDHLHPEVALIGVGIGNRYGHPDSEVISRLEERHIATWRTDLHGSVELTFFEKQLQVRPRRRDQDGEKTTNAH